MANDDKTTPAAPGKSADPKPVTTIETARLKVRLGMQDGLLTVTGVEVSGRLLTVKPAKEEGGAPERKRDRVRGELALPEKFRSDLARLVEAHLRGG